MEAIIGIEPISNGLQPFDLPFIQTAMYRF